MKKKDFEQALNDSVAKLCKVPFPGVADIAIEIIERVKTTLSNSPDDTELTLEMLVRSLAVTGAKFNLEQTTKDKEE